VAIPDAVRRSGSLLLRALAVSGLATAAWLVCGGVASADDHLDEVVSTLDAVDLVVEEHQAEAAELLTAAVPQEPVAIFKIPALAFTGQPVEQPPAMDDVFPAEVFPVPVDDLADAAEYPEYPDGTDHSGSSGYSGHSRAGSASNAMPAPVYEAKVAARAAARAAAEATLAPPVQAPPPQPATAPEAEPVTRHTALPPPTAPVVTQHSWTTANAGVTWEAPEHKPSAPAPKQAPAPSAPTASSNSADNGGGHRGGLIASLTGQSGTEPATTWSAERRDDGRSPGSVPGLPSTSPD
jgi:hypothetical protein